MIATRLRNGLLAFAGGAATILAGLLLNPAAAHAGNVSWSVGISSNGGYVVPQASVNVYGGGYRGGYYRQPAPQYYAPPPVVVVPAPVYAPAPVYVAPPPVYVAPRPVYVAPSPPRYQNHNQYRPRHNNDYGRYPDRNYYNGRDYRR